ncbi:MAG TPA: hypothetical protein VNR60_08345 [Croceibacterium sp.]|nr:hypothetical protein [Croceibacterium sp.]
MNGPKTEPSREERLAAKLRENLRRRKAQSRELGTRAEGTGDDALSKEAEDR